MKRLAALLLLLCSAAPAFAAEPSQAQSVSWQHTGTHSFEQQNPGYGVSYRYSSPVGWVDVYVYSLGRSNWQTGVGDPKFAEHFDSTIADVRQFAENGMYSGLEVGTTQDQAIADQLFRAVGFRYALKGKQMHSETYLTARNGLLLKYRISIFAGSGLNFDAVARQFIEENLRDDPTVKGVVLPPTGGGSKRSI